MKTWLFYSNDITVNVYEKKRLSAADLQQIKAEGLHKMPFETDAEDEAQAVDNMLAHFKENKAALEEFIKNDCIPSIIFELIYAAD
ncbi:hypothetical protein AWR26_16895 [Kosakonia oryzae]|uniref:Uncharacterized protein n=1 Tax=Kosakonia oryzae TaxID=497725 RepID=A0ABM6C3Q4_9ENTR|nr:hypothetical protein AWR26_16895 [Kosakonia oryzae]UDJ85146.1 hypothetical protein I5186_16940 [Kosakonia oryzae]